MKAIICMVLCFAGAALWLTASAGAPNLPPPTECPSGYTEDAGSTDRQLLCTRIVTRNVPGPTVEVIKEVPGPTVYVNVPVPGPTVYVNVPGKTIIKKVQVIKWRTKVVVKKVTHTVFKKYCPKKPNGDKIAG